MLSGRGAAGELYTESSCFSAHRQVVHLCLECEKTSTLLQVLDFVPSQAQKTLIFTCSVAETETVCKVSLSSGQHVLISGRSRSSVCWSEMDRGWGRALQSHSVTPGSGGGAVLGRLKTGPVTVLCGCVMWRVKDLVGEKHHICTLKKTEKIIMR